MMINSKNIINIYYFIHFYQVQKSLSVLALLKKIISKIRSKFSKFCQISKNLTIGLALATVSIGIYSDNVCVSSLE